MFHVRRTVQPLILLAVLAKSISVNLVMFVADTVMLISWLQPPILLAVLSRLTLAHVMKMIMLFAWLKPLISQAVSPPGDVRCSLHDD